jgi:hypothetical protein
MRRVAVSLAGPLAFGAASVVAGRRTRGYRARDEPISALASKGAPAAPVMIGGFLALAAGQAVFAREVRGAAAVPPPLPVLVSAAAATTAVAGLARNSARHCPSRLFGDDDATWVDELHGGASFVTFLLWLTMPFVASTHAEQGSMGYRRASRAIGVASVSAFIASGLLARKRSPWSGAGQRLMLAAAFTWYPLAAVQRA